MIPNLYIGNGWKSPNIYIGNGCLGLQGVGNVYFTSQPALKTSTLAILRFRALFIGMVSSRDPLSDLQIGDTKGHGVKHLAVFFSFLASSGSGGVGLRKRTRTTQMSDLLSGGCWAFRRQFFFRGNKHIFEKHVQQIWFGFEF